MRIRNLPTLICFLTLSLNAWAMDKGLEKCLKQNASATEVLVCNDYDIRSLVDFPKFSNLRKLVLVHNKLKNLEGLENLPETLTSLDLAFNQLTSLKGLPSILPQLKTLRLTQNHLQSLQDLPAQLPSLLALLASSNLISQLFDPLSTPQLLLLDLENNHITHFGEVLKIRQALSGLLEINLYSNPLGANTLSLLNADLKALLALMKNRRLVYSLTPQKLPEKLEIIL